MQRTSSEPMESRPRLITPVLVVGCLIVLVGCAIRASFGVFQIPIEEEFSWPRTEFSLAIAIQNLAWGFGAPFFGAFAEKLGDRKAIILGAVLYALGVVLTTGATSPLAIQFYEILVGFGIAGTGFGVILAVVGRARAPEHRAMSLAIASLMAKCDSTMIRSNAAAVSYPKKRTTLLVLPLPSMIVVSGPSPSTTISLP